MKIILMSDSHGRNHLIDEIMEKHKDADAFLHCGDIECDEYVYPNMRIVRGNNDYYADFPEKMKIRMGPFRVLMLHSHLCYARDRLTYLSKMAKKEGCDTVFFGHTHVACDKVVNGIRLINPGSLYYSRDGRPISYCIITVDNDMQVEFKFAPFE